MADNDWQPDWENADVYPDPETTSMTKWAWEFLRRNKKYQAFYKKYSEDAPYGFDGSTFDPPANDGETWEEYKNRVGVDFTFTTKYKEEILEFGLIGVPPNPSDSELPLFTCFFVSEYPIVDEEGFMDRNQKIIRDRPLLEAGIKSSMADINLLCIDPCDFHPDDRWEINVKFNLVFPLESQINQIMAKLKDIQNTAKKEFGIRIIKKQNRSENWKEYLRLLDADLKNIDKIDMQQVIFGGIYKSESNSPTKQAIDGLKSAKNIRDHDYRYIPYLKNPAGFQLQELPDEWHQ